MERQSATKVQKTSSRGSRVQTKSARSPSGAHPFLELQRSIGNQAIQRLINSPYIQTKLQVSTPGDPYEQEADRVADTVMRMTVPQATQKEATTPIGPKPLASQIRRLVQREPEQPSEEEKEETIATKPVVQRVPLAVREDDEEEKVATKSLSSQLSPSPRIHSVHRTASAVIQRLCTECEEEKQQDQGQSGEMVHRKSASERLPDDDDVEEQQVQPKGTQTAAPKVTTSVAANIHAMNGGGSPLPDTTRAFFEPRFGADFSQVRVHTDARAAGTAKSLNAKAFTVGRSIAFGAGQFVPQSREGQRLLAHELTHVVQQSGNSLVAGTQRISRAEASVQRDLLDDFTSELTSIGENVVAGVEQAGSAVVKGVETVSSEVAGGVEAAGSAVTSGAEGLGAAVTSGAQAIASAVSSGAKTVAETVDSAKEQAAAISGIANENTEEALDKILDWRNLQINWDSEQGRIIRSWAARLDPEIVRRVRNISPSALFSVVSVPDEIRQAAGELAKQ